MPTLSSSDKTNTSTNYPTATLIRRLMAIVYDSLLLLGVAFAYGVCVWAIRKASGGNTMEPLQGFTAIVEQICLYFTLVSYYVFCWAKRGQTLGMKTWRLQLEGKDQQLITAKMAFFRCGLAIFSMAFFGLGYLWSLIDKDRLSWHDHISHSRVVVLPKH